MIAKTTLKEQPFIMSGDTDWKPAGEGITRKILGHDNQVMMVCVQFSKGAVGSAHSHIHRQVCYVESGVFEVTIAGDRKTLQRGDSFFVAPNLEHGVVALEAGMLIDVFTPSREDFL